MSRPDVELMAARARGEGPALEAYRGLAPADRQLVDRHMDVSGADFTAALVDAGVMARSYTSEGVDVADEVVDVALDVNEVPDLAEIPGGFGSPYRSWWSPQLDRRAQEDDADHARTGLVQQRREKSRAAAFEGQSVAYAVVLAGQLGEDIDAGTIARGRGGHTAREFVDLVSAMQDRADAVTEAKARRARAAAQERWAAQESAVIATRMAAGLPVGMTPRERINYLSAVGDAQDALRGIGPDTPVVISTTNAAHPAGPFAVALEPNASTQQRAADDERVRRREESILQSADQEERVWLAGVKRRGRERRERRKDMVALAHAVVRLSGGGDKPQEQR